MKQVHTMLDLDLPKESNLPEEKSLHFHYELL